MAVSEMAATGIDQSARTVNVALRTALQSEQRCVGEVKPHWPPIRCTDLPLHTGHCLERTLNFAIRGLTFPVTGARRVAHEKHGLHARVRVNWAVSVQRGHQRTFTCLISASL